LNRKENKQMLRKIIIGALLLSLALIIVGCSNPTSNPTPSGPIKATLIEPEVTDGSVSIPVSEVENNWNVSFKVEAQDGNMNFMAYLLDGEIYVRANVCPPCWSTGFSLEEDILICDRCATTFKAQTGEGISGACVDYPKASVPYEIINGNIVMSSADLITAYQDTIEPGWP
jgi:nitrite reductase/ring-hydroxylating ferredoxin subunit